MMSGMLLSVQMVLWNVWLRFHSCGTRVAWKRE